MRSSGTLVRQGNAGGQRGAAVFPAGGPAREKAPASVGAEQELRKPNTSEAPDPRAIAREPERGAP